MNNTALSWCTNLHSAPSPSLLKPTPLPTLLIIIAQFLIIDSTGHFEAMGLGSCRIALWFCLGALLRGKLGQNSSLKTVQWRIQGRPESAPYF